MTTYLVTYDLKDADAARYTRVHDAIKRIDPRAQEVQSSVWFVDADQNAEQVGDAIWDAMQQARDRLLVMKAPTEAALIYPG
jgi:CRISPR/Cas system-associated endoribonuclease Cas2